MFPCIFSIKVNFSTRTTCEFVGVLHWILIQSLEFLALLRTLKWHQLHFLYWNFIVPAWPHFFVLHMFSLWLPLCRGVLRESGREVCLCSLQPCLSLPEPGTQVITVHFSPRTKQHCWLKGQGHLFKFKSFPTVWQVGAERSWRVPLFPLAEQEWGACCHGEWHGCGTAGTGVARDCTQDSGKSDKKKKRSGKQRKGKVSISVSKTRLSPVLEDSTWSSICFCYPDGRRECPHNTIILSRALRQGGAALF